jgi:tRNA G10  N-methylase Trm11
MLPELEHVNGVSALPLDARNLHGIASGSIDVVLTDPPWAEYKDVDASFDPFMRAAISEIARVLRTGGRISMLMARRRSAELKPFWRAADLRVERTFDILVNGHPATVIAGRKGLAPIVKGDG